MEKIVIKVSGGMVSEVYATSREIDIVVIDEDALEQVDDEESGAELPRYQIY